MKSVTEIPAAMTTIDRASGTEVHQPMSWKLLPPGKGECPVCAVEHNAGEPHNAQSLFYQMAFAGVVGRSPTWADAMAHCSYEVSERWKGELLRLQAWTEPAAGEAPVRDHGIE